MQYICKVLFEGKSQRVRPKNLTKIRQNIVTFYLITHPTRQLAPITGWVGHKKKYSVLDLGGMGKLKQSGRDW